MENNEMCNSTREEGKSSINDHLTEGDIYAPDSQKALEGLKMGILTGKESPFLRKLILSGISDFSLPGWEEGASTLP